MADSKTPQPDDTVLGGDAGVPGTSGSAAGGATAPKNKDANKPPER